MKNIQDMGSMASSIFAGNCDQSTLKLLYSETAELFADLIRNNLPQNPPYRILDAGAYKGELMSSIMDRIGQRSNFNITATDVNGKALDENTSADRKVEADLTELPFGNKEFDLACARYVLAWNNVSRQQSILENLNRVSRKVILQHAGADDTDTVSWQKRMHNLLGGKVPKLLRSECYFSSAQEIEGWLKASGIAYRRVQYRRVDFVSRVFIERYGLGEKEALEVLRILGDKDYIFQTTWIIE